MEQLVSTFSGDLCLGQPTACVSETSVKPRMLLYKNNGFAVDQERRWRSELAEVRRQNSRNAQFDSNRDLQLLMQGDSNPWKQQRRTRQDRLMLAEWFLFKPQAFENDYLFKLCPKGRHVFILASKGMTHVYARSGNCLATVLTRLPGGGLGQSSSQMHRYYTMLDCIMIGTPTAKKTHQPNSNNDDPLVFKVLDFMAFKSTVYCKSKFVDRCLWLEGFHKEQIETFEPDDVVRFEIIHVNQCDETSMNAVFAAPPPFDLDGVLFYHKDVGYVRGPTPLVGWLKPYMLAEWFPKPDYHAAYMQDMPSDYKNYVSDIQCFRDTTRKRRTGRNDPEEVLGSNEEVAVVRDSVVCSGEISMKPHKNAGGATDNAGYNIQEIANIAVETNLELMDEDLR